MTSRTNDTPLLGEDRFAEVVIIGAGIAGSLAAWSLAGLGRKVLVLDAGPRIDRVDAVERFRASPVKGSNAPYENTWYAPQPSDDNPDSYYVQTAPAGSPMTFVGQYVRGVGGTSWHWTAHAERHYPSDFEMETAYGKGANWPITYDEIQPWYIEVEKAWGVAGSLTDYIGPERSGGFPLPPVPPSYLDLTVGKACRAVGMEFGVYPHARNSIPYDGRPQCCGNASCRFLCPIAAKYDASAHVVKAEDAGATVLDKRVVYKIELDPDNKQVTAVYYRHPDGWTGRARARIFILSAHAIESAKLLLMSKTDARPNGVANSSGLVGKNLIALADVNTTALTKPGNPVFPYRGPVSATGGLKSWRDGAFRGEFAAFATNFVNGGWNASLGPANRAQRLIQQGVLGEELNRRIADETAREVQLGSMVDVLPDEANTIVPDYDKLDGLGLPRPKITFDWGPYTEKGIEKAKEVHHQILDALGTDDSVPRATAVEMDTAVIAGTTRMGRDPNLSVVDSGCRSHDHDNLYIIGTSVYPTTGIVSPSMTAAALALRAAQDINKTLGQG